MNYLIYSLEVRGGGILMYVEMDLVKIKKLAQLKEKDNIRFRSELKQTDMSSADVDKVVHKIYNEVIEQIDCTQCANCCNVLKPTLDDNDIRRFVSSLDMEEKDFRKRYIETTESDDDGRNYEFNALPCPFLVDNKCSNYDNRPENCRSFPNLHKDDFTSRLWGVINNYEVCPIVFNVYEELKSELRNRREH